MDGKVNELIISIIQERLIQHHSAVLPDLGVLFLREQPASLQVARNTILPPEYIIEFLQTADIQDYTISFAISQEKKLDIDSCISLFNDFVKHVYASLQKQGSFKLGDLGTFNLKDDIISFEQGAMHIPGLSAGRKSLQAIPVKRVEALAAKNEPVVRKIEKKRRRLGWVSVAAIALVAVSALLLVQILRPGLESNPAFTSVDYENDRLNTNPLELEDANKSYTLDELRNEVPEETVTEDSVSIKEEIVINEIDPIEEISEEDIADVEDEEKKIKTNPIPEGNQELIKKPDLGSFTVVPNNLQYDKEASCVIVVGAFGKVDNVEKIITRIESMGYTPYTDVLRGLIRVGAQSPCETELLEYNKALMRKRIEPTAYILDIQ